MTPTIEELREKILEQLNYLLGKIDDLTHEDLLLSVKSISELSDIDKEYQSLLDEIYKNRTIIDNHKADLNNPHKVTKALIGLSNVLNYPATSNPNDNSDKEYVLAKGLNSVNVVVKKNDHLLNNLQQSLNTFKERVESHLSNNSNPHSVTKLQVGLSNLANLPATSDINDSSTSKYALARGVFDVNVKADKAVSVANNAMALAIKTRPIRISTVDPVPDDWEEGDVWFVYED